MTEHSRKALPQDLAGRRIVLTAQRRADEFASAVERRGATVIHAPTLSHVPHVDDPELLARTRDLIDTAPDVVVITTGVGFRGWLEAAENAGLGDALRSTLGSAYVVARGPKAHGALQGAGVHVEWTAESELAQEITEHLLGREIAQERVAVQHHGAGSDGIDDALVDAGAEVISLVVYRWGPAPDPAAVERAVTGVARAEVDCVAFTAAPGARAFLEAAAQAGLLEPVLEKMRSGAVLAAAVGDTTAAPLRAEGIEPAVPERFRMGALIRIVTALLRERRLTSEVPSG